MAEVVSVSHCPNAGFQIVLRNGASFVVHGTSQYFWSAVEWIFKERGANPASNDVIARLTALEKGQKQMSLDFTAINNALAAMQSLDTAVATELQNLQTAVNDLTAQVAGPGSTADQATLNGIAASIQSSVTALSAASQAAGAAIGSGPAGAPAVADSGPSGAPVATTP